MNRPYRYFLILTAVLLSGCSTSQESLLPVDESTTMASLWTQQTGGGQQLYDQRSQLRRPLVSISPAEQQHFMRTDENETASQFSRLPDPDMVMYVFPHLTSDSGVPVPGYSTVFPFYGRVHYALPGERTEVL